MSRSRRKTPICGITTAKSEALWKAKAARRLRVATRASLKGKPEGEMLSGKRWDVVDPWDGPKDGKRWAHSRHWKLLRK